MILPQATPDYDTRDQDRMRAAVADALTQLQQAPSGWVQATGTATRATFDTTTVTLPVLAQAVKALIDDLVLRAKT